MWQRFTERARRVIFFAQEEAGNSGQNMVTPENMLLGLLRNNDHVAARMLAQMGISMESLREAVLLQSTSASREKLRKDMNLTPKAKRAIDLAYDEARLLDCNYIGTEHLLLGLIREEGSTGPILIKLGATLERARKEWLAIRDDLFPANAPQTTNRDSAFLPGLGHLGRLRDSSLSEQTTLANSESSYQSLKEIAAIKDRFAYQEMMQEGHLFTVPLTSVKLSIEMRSGDTIDAHTIDTRTVPGCLVKLLNIGSSGGYCVRIQEGEFAGKMGWITPEQFEYIGPDTLPFP